MALRLLCRMRPIGTLRPQTTAHLSRFHTSRVVLEGEKEAKEEEAQEGVKGEAKEEKKEEKVDYQALLKEKEAELKESHDSRLRTLADMQNLRDRTARDMENSKKYALSKFSKDLLDVADTLELAIKAAGPHLEKGNKDLKDYNEGILLTEKTMLQVFGRFGITKFKSLGEKFDPNLHDGLYAYEDPKCEVNTVGTIVKEGYMMKDMVLRAAQCGTIKAPKK